MRDFAVPSYSLQLGAVGVNLDSTARVATQEEQSERKLPIQMRGISCPDWEAEPCPVSSGPPICSLETAPATFRRVHLTPAFALLTAR